MKHTEQEYIDYNPFWGEEAIVTLRTVKIVKTRKPHPCFSWNKETAHEIAVGSTARFEKALIDGDYFGRYYWCTDCLDKEIHEVLYCADDE